jgi:hypothetical protein
MAIVVADFDDIELAGAVDSLGLGFNLSIRAIAQG